MSDPMDCSMSGFPVLHLPELVQTHVHRVDDAIQPSHALLSLLLLPSIFPSIRGISNELDLFITKYWSFSFTISPSNEYSGLISLGIGWFNLLVVQGTLKHLLLLQLFSSPYQGLSASTTLRDFSGFSTLVK